MTRWPRTAPMGAVLLMVTMFALAVGSAGGSAGARTQPAESKLTKVWTARLIGPGTAPVVADGNVYVTAIAAKLPKRSGAVGSDVYAFDGTCPPAPAHCAETLTWSHPFRTLLAGKQPFAVNLTPAAVGDGNVYLGQNQIGADQYDGSELAFGATSGSPVFSAGQGGTSTAAVADGVVVSDWQFQCCLGEESFSGTEVLNASTGVPLYITPPGTTSPPALGAGSLFVLSGAALSAYDASGKVCPAPPGPPEVIQGYAKALGFPEACAPLWTATTDGSIVAAAAVAGHEMYVGSSTGELYAFPAGGCGSSTCPPTWTGTTGGAITTSVAVTGSTAFVTSSNGVLSAFPAGGCRSSSCAPTWTAAVGASPSAPTVAGSLVYVASSSGELEAFAAGGCGATTCAASWRAVLHAPSDTAPAVGNGLVFVTDTHHDLYAFRQPTG